MRDLALALEVGGAGFERQPVRLLQAKLGRVLDRQHALAGVDHLRQGVEHRRLARAGTARDDDVEAAGAGDLERGRHLVATSSRSPAIMSSVIGLAENLRIEIAVPRKLTAAARSR